MANAFRPLTILSWNVRGLGDKRKCDNVRLAFPCPLPSISCLQETKLTAIDQFKAASILPRPLSSSFNFKPSSGSSGGLLTAWDPNHLVLLSYPTDRYSITTSFRSTAANTEFAVTNCYGPCVHAEKQAVLEELISLYSSISGPWVLLGDFNLIRSPAERSNDNFDSTESGWFNNAIDAMALQELTLTDRRFTWSNHQEEPILAMLDRFLVSTECLTRRLKRCRADLKCWKRTRRSPKDILTNYALVIGMMDLLEECRPLYPAERNLRTLVSDAAQEHATQLACYWRQRGKVWTCTLGDDNTQFFHMSATVHWRRNQIRALQQDDGAILDSHEDKAALLHSFYCQLLGQSSQGPLPDDLQSLFATSSLAHCPVLNARTEVHPILHAQANWHLVCDELLNLMHEFHQETADLMRINKAYLALLPKKANAVLPKDFRPISLQNGVTKICSKGMTIRLQPHPLVDDLPCPVLQYADDTLIVLKAVPEPVSFLRNLLQEFSQATSLHINFDKSNFLPICLGQDEAQSMADLLGCPIATFPQTYLGLPLSTHKLRLLDSQPLLRAVESYIPGWCGKVLTPSGRTILANVVLAARAVYAMCSSLLPKGTVDVLDARRRAFIWTGEQSCNGAQCKAAWEIVCWDKQHGGLSVENLLLQNYGLLCKFWNKLLMPPTTSWQRWFHRTYGLPAGRDLGDTHHLDTPTWQMLLKMLSHFRASTRLLVRSLDWAPYHCRRFHDFKIGNSWDLHLHDRLSSVATAERDLGDDVRGIGDEMLPFTASSFYASRMDSRPIDVFAEAIWHNAATPRCKHFLWLTHHDRLPSTALLHRRSIIDSTMKTNITSFSNAPALALPDSNARIRSAIVTSLLWNIWKCRNNLQFNGVLTPPQMVLRAASEDLKMWRHRLPHSTIPISPPNPKHRSVYRPPAYCIRSLLDYHDADACQSTRIDDPEPIPSMAMRCRLGIGVAQGHRPYTRAAPPRQQASQSAVSASEVDGTPNAVGICAAGRGPLLDHTAHARSGRRRWIANGSPERHSWTSSKSWRGSEKATNAVLKRARKDARRRHSRINGMAAGGK
nr:unnamed protein product [Digitaria exilis]